jgi:hypothetical protein
MIAVPAIALRLKYEYLISLMDPLKSQWLRVRLDETGDHALRIIDKLTRLMPPGLEDDLDCWETFLTALACLGPLGNGWARWRLDSLEFQLGHWEELLNVGKLSGPATVERPGASPGP